MFKDIIKISHKHNILLENSVFKFSESKVCFKDYIFYINRLKFFYGIEGAVIKSKEELFVSDKINTK